MSAPPPNGAATQAVRTSVTLVGRRPADTLWSETWRRFRKHRLATFGAAVLIVMVVAVVAGPFVYRVPIDEIDFKAKLITIRERKRERGHHGTRSVPISSQLAKALKKWLAGRKTGPTFQWKEGVPLTGNEAHTHLELTLADSKWDKLKGWHVFRHSFASNCAARGLDQRIIDSWMGHMTEAMVRRYRHHFPDQHQKALQSVFG